MLPYYKVQINGPIDAIKAKTQKFFKKLQKRFYMVTSSRTKLSFSAICFKAPLYDRFWTLKTSVSKKSPTKDILQVPLENKSTIIM